MIDKVMICVSLISSGLLIIGTYLLHLGIGEGWICSIIGIFGLVYSVPRIWLDPNYNDPYSFHLRDKSKYIKKGDKC